MSRPVMFRAARRTDLEAIRSLLADAGLPPDGVAERLATFLVADLEGAVVAVGGLEVSAPVALLRSVVVSPDRRCRGVGASLCSRLLDGARALGVQRCYLLTETAEAFFERLGFETAPREQAPEAIRSTDEFARLCPESARLMTRSLTDPPGHT
jgi:N-acetylglutamate synthase-like GNAT family acetyltransferase